MNRARKVVEEVYEKYIKSNQTDEEDMRFLNGIREICEGAERIKEEK